MKKILFPVFLMVLSWGVGHAQSAKDSSQPKKPPHKEIGIGVKAGLNFSNVTNASEINASSSTGFNAGLFYEPSWDRLIGSKTELLFSQQGYKFSTDSGSGTNKLNYIMLLQLMTVNITRFVQLQIGAQMGYLLNAKADVSTTTGNTTVDQALSYYNRFDYGFSGGLEIHPILGVLVGARYVLSLNELYKQPAYGIPNESALNFKNNTVQVFAGWKF